MSAGKIVSCQRGLIQDPAQLQRQQGMRQQGMLGACDGAEEECWDGSSRNGGAAACAAANGRPRIVLLTSRKREQRNRRESERRRERRGTVEPVEGIDEESGTDSEGEDPNGGAAACAAAMDDDCWWERVLREAGVSWEGSAQEFVD